MTANQTAKLLQLPKTGIPKDIHGLVITCSYCGCMYIVTGITDPVNRAKGGMTIQPPKTDNSMRKIALSEETMELLKQAL